MMSMISLFVLRRKQPRMQRPFAAIFYPVFPTVALVISAVCMLAIRYYNLPISMLFFAGLLVAIFMLMGKHKVSK